MVLDDGFPEEDGVFLFWGLGCECLVKGMGKGMGMGCPRGADVPIDSHSCPP